jgi:hypothetical protein
MNNLLKYFLIGALTLGIVIELITKFKGVSKKNVLKITPTAFKRSFTQDALSFSALLFFLLLIFPLFWAGGLVNKGQIFIGLFMLFLMLRMDG